MKSRIKVFLILFRVGFFKISKYVEATIVNICNSLVVILVQFFVWSAITHNSMDIDYSFYQMFSYIIYSQLLSSVYPSGLGNQIGQLVKTGDIALYLLKPLSVIKQLVCENIGVSFYKLLFISLPICFMGIVLSENNLCANNLLYFLIIICISYIIFAFIDLIFGILQFYTSTSWGISSMKYAIITLCSGRLLPLEFYPEWCLRVLDLLPFKFLYDVPICNIIGERTIFIEKELIWGVIWIVVLYAIYKICYSNAIKRITVQGG